MSVFSPKIRLGWLCLIPGFVIGLGTLLLPARDPMPDPSLYPAGAVTQPATGPTLADSLVFNIPRLADIAVDGKSADWGERGFAVDVLANTEEHPRPRSDFDGSFRLGWNAQGLLILVKVTDVVDQEMTDPAAGGDCVELYVAARRKCGQGLRVAIGPGVEEDHPDVRIHALQAFDDSRRCKTAGTQPALHIVAARTRTDNGYVLEALVPWSDLKLAPAPGMEVAFQLKVNDTDGPHCGAQLMWYPNATRGCSSAGAYRLRLSEAPSPAQHAAVYASYVRQHRVRISVRGTQDLAGQTVAIRQGERVLKTDVLRPDFVQTDRVSCTFSLPMPAAGTSYGPLDVFINDRPLTTVALPPPGDSEKWVLPYEELLFKPCVFSGPGFPQPDFENPDQVEDIIGAYELRTTYYDAQYHVVERADEPGRYGAVVQIRAADGKVFTRYRTLFREAADFSWRNADMPFQVKLPPQMGIDSVELRQQAASVSQYFKNLLGDGLTFEIDSAVLLAGLYEAERDHSPLTPLARDQKWWAGLKSIRGEAVPPHLTYLPQDFEQQRKNDPRKKWPLIVFLHGKGERGGNLEMVRWAGLAGVFEQHRDLPFIMVAPQCDWDDVWSPWAVDALLDKVEAEYPIDTDRVYLTGMSMGGYGTWATAAEFPQRFAAIAPICGGGDPGTASRLAGVPIWAFHGHDDDIVPLAESQRMVQAIKKLGGDAKLTILPNTGHDAWDKVYYGDELLAWLLEHKRNQASPPPAAPQSH